MPFQRIGAHVKRIFEILADINPYNPVCIASEAEVINVKWVRNTRNEE